MTTLPGAFAHPADCGLRFEHRSAFFQHCGVTPLVLQAGNVIVGIFNYQHEPWQQAEQR